MSADVKHQPATPLDSLDPNNATAEEIADYQRHMTPARTDALDLASFEGHTRADWAWQRFGKEWCLTAQHGMRAIILAVRKGAITSLVDGLLRPFNPDHPEARLIAAAPQLLALAREQAQTIERLGADNEQWETERADMVKGWKSSAELVDKQRDEIARLREALQRYMDGHPCAALEECPTKNEARAALAAKDGT